MMKRVYTPLVIGYSDDPRIPELPCKSCGKSNHAPNFYNAEVTASPEVVYHLCEGDKRWAQTFTEESSNGALLQVL